MVAKLGNICFESNICSGSKSVFDFRQKAFFVSDQQKLFPQHMFPARLNWETVASATMFTSLARLRGTKILFCGCDLKYFYLLRGTILKHQIS